MRRNVFIMSSWKGVEWAMWHASLNSALFSQPKWYVDIVALFAWNVSYKALYDLGYMLHNPFGDRRIDVAHEVIGAKSFCFNRHHSARACAG